MRNGDLSGYVNAMIFAARILIFIANAVEHRYEARTGGPGYPIIWYERFDAPGPSARLLQDVTELARAKRRIEANLIFRMFAADDEPAPKPRRGRPPRREQPEQEGSAPR